MNSREPKHEETNQGVKEGMGFLEKTEDEGQNKNFKVRPIKSSIY